MILTILIYIFIAILIFLLLMGNVNCFSRKYNSYLYYILKNYDDFMVSSYNDHPVIKFRIQDEIYRLIFLDYSDKSFYLTELNYPYKYRVNLINLLLILKCYIKFQYHNKKLQYHNNKLDFAEIDLKYKPKGMK